MSETFDPTNNENLDENREAVAARDGDKILERVGLKNRVYFEEKGTGGFWWYQNAAGEWIGRNKQLFETYLKRSGVEAVRDDGRKISELDLVLLHIATNCSVVYAGPLAGHKKGVQINNGHRVLVTRSPQIPAPEPGDCDVIMSLVDQMFGPQFEGDKIDQRPYFLGWWKYSLECLRAERKAVGGVCLVLAGEKECGKTLMKELISLSFGGREAKPYRYMTKQENFNGELIGAELWVIDDEQAMNDAKSRSEFGANIKQTVADPKYRIRGMMRDSVILEFFKRLMVCVNREPERLMVLPQLDSDIDDKISVLLAHKHEMPMPTLSPDDKAEFWSQLMMELPRFIYWLLNEYEIRPEFYGRFGVQHFHHPDLCRDLFEMSRERTLWEQINKVLFRDKADDAFISWRHELASTELRNLLASDDAPLTKSEKNSLPLPNFFGKCLAKIEKEFPERVRLRKSNGKKAWLIVDEEHSVNDALDIDQMNEAYRAGSDGSVSNDDSSDTE